MWSIWFQPTQGDKQRFILEIFNIMNMANEPGMLALSTVYEAPAGAVNLHHTFFGQLATFIEVSYIGVIDGNTIDMTFTKPDNYVPPPFVGYFISQFHIALEP